MLCPVGVTEGRPMAIRRVSFEYRIYNNMDSRSRSAQSLVLAGPKFRDTLGGQDGSGLEFRAGESNRPYPCHVEKRQNTPSSVEVLVACDVTYAFHCEITSIHALAIIVWHCNQKPF
jgi:hypothetical protein